MRKRPVFHADLGQFFKALRVERGWSQRQAADLADRRGLTEVSRQVLFRLERGQVKNPEPETLRQIGALYGLDYESVVTRFVAARYGTTHASDLPRQTDEVGSRSTAGGRLNVGSAFGSASSGIEVGEKAFQAMVYTSGWLYDLADEYRRRADECEQRADDLATLAPSALPADHEREARSAQGDRSDARRGAARTERARRRRGA